MRRDRWRFAWAWVLGAVLATAPAAAVRQIYVVGAGETRVVDARGESSGRITVLTGEGAKAGGTLTCTGNPTDTQTVVLAAKTYTFVAGALDADGKVDLGADGGVSLGNLFAAITLGDGAGTAYASLMTANADATASAPVATVTATGTLTLTGNAVNAETVTIGGKVYTYQTTLTNVDGNVLIGATASDSLDNLIAAINLGAGSGTLYAAATTLHPTASAAAGAGDTMVVTANDSGCGGNAIATTETMLNGSWGAATLAGGTSTMAVEALVGGTAGDALATTDTSTGFAYGAATLSGGTDVTATISYVYSEAAGTSNLGHGHQTLTDTSGGALLAITDWPLVKVTSSAEGPTYVGVW